LAKVGKTIGHPQNLFYFLHLKECLEKQSIESATTSSCAANKSNAFILAQVADDVFVYQTT